MSRAGRRASSGVGSRVAMDAANFALVHLFSDSSRLTWSGLLARPGHTQTTQSRAANLIAFACQKRPAPADCRQLVAGPAIGDARQLPAGRPAGFSAFKLLFPFICFWPLSFHFAWQRSDSRGQADFRGQIIATIRLQSTWARLSSACLCVR